jgi:general secretion pathway protein G
MPMWAICREHRAGANWLGQPVLRGQPVLITARMRRPERDSGFTLVEIIVVLLLFALLVAVSAPGLARLYGRIQLNADMREIQSRIAAVPVLAYASGDEGLLADLLQRQVELPSGWTLLDDGGIYVRANGVCSGGTLRLDTPSGERELVLEQPFCEPQTQP